jgi:NAD(P)-dependent dehydrogenase (short-subunit alcohol dehydrogenase family)
MPRPVVFVTGAGRGVGRAVATAFAAAGYDVALAGRTETGLREVADEIARLTGGRAHPILCDVGQRDSVATAISTAEREVGDIEVLVNNAGVADSAPFTKMTDELWDQMLAVNLTGTYLCMRAVLPAMFARGRGRVINIASTAGRTGYRYTAAYCAAKHGVVGLTRAVALEAAPMGVTVNAICPGWTDTDMTNASIARIVETTGRSSADARRTLERMNPQGRLITPEEVAALALFLASSDARGINGQALGIDGGEVVA